MELPFIVYSILKQCWSVGYVSLLTLSFIYIDIDYGLLRLPNVDYWLTAGVTGQHGMLTHPRHLIPSLVYPGDRVCYVLIFVLFFGVRDWLRFVIFAFSCSTSLFYGKMVNLLARVYYFNYFASVYSFFPTQLMSFIYE